MTITINLVPFLCFITGYLFVGNPQQWWSWVLIVICLLFVSVKRTK